MLEESFYQRDNTLAICEELLGKVLYTSIEGEITGGYITEVEAYQGATDRACHAYNNRRTKRTEVMFSKGGICYVYLCYGMHHLLNVVTHTEDMPHAILIRSLYPTKGIEIIKRRHPLALKRGPHLTGPGNVTRALGITQDFNGLSLRSEKIWIEESPSKLQGTIMTSPRIGVDYAGEDALLPWRYVLTAHMEGC